jgi:hypothetical protein
MTKRYQRVSFDHCVVCPSTYSFLLPLWYLLVIVSSVLLLTPSYCLFGIFWSLCRLSFYLLLLIAPLVSFGHCVVCPSTYSFLLPLWYLLVIVLSVLLLTPSYCFVGIFWSLCCLSFFYLLLLIASLVLTKIYPRGNHNPYIEEGQTTQRPKYTQGAIIIRISKKDRQHNDQKIPKRQ